MKNNIGVLVTNIGTPASPTSPAVREYLETFLLDPRVVQLPRWIWKPILYSFILPFRAKKSAQLYQKIWTAQGSPLLVFSKKIVNALEEVLQIPVELGMHYSEPSIKNALDNLSKKNVSEIVVLPLFPQYSTTTTEASMDAINNYLPKSCNTKVIKQYAEDENYISAICQSIQSFWQLHGKAQHLLFSFHGIPERYVTNDPYLQQCNNTVKQITSQLNLLATDWSLSFQSRLGKAKWLTPYTDEILQTLPKQGIKHLQVICPGFAVDCLETLEEIAIRGKEQFLASGGETFEYIPALNDSDLQITMLANLIRKYSEGDSLL